MATALAPRVRRPADPRSDPRFQKVEAKLNGDATRLKQHPPARKKAAEAQAAAKGPANEKLAGAKANQVGKMEQAPTGKPDENSFLTLLRAEIEKALPKNNEEAKDFIDADQKQQITQNVRGNVKEQRDSASKKVETAAKEPPNQAGVPAKEVTPIPGEPPPLAPQVDAPGAMPAPKRDADISLEQSKKSADQEMADNKVTPTQLKKANDPRFSAVLDAKGAVEKQADTAPQQYRAAERGILTSTAAKATADSRAGSAAFSLVKRNAGAKVSAHQSAAKLRDEQRRQEFTNKIEGIYNQTKADVENKLSTMESDVMRAFDAGIDTALANMKSSAQREIDDFYDDRYSGLFGWTDWIADKFKDTPQQVKDIIKRARSRFTAEMDRLVVRIAANVEQRLKEAKDLIAKGQADVKAEVAKLPANLQAFGRQAEQEMAGRFDEMRQGVDDRKNALAQKLAEKYKEASAKADEAAKKMEEENAGLFYKFAKYLGEIVKIILEFKDKLMALLRKAADLIMDILSDPIGFLGGLLGAIKKGVGQFVDNVWTHLKRGFMEWLFGSLASAGIEIPADLSLPSILKLVMGILGLTYDRLRARAVKLIGERNVKILEKLYDYVKTLITEGPAALWAKVKDDLSNLKEMVIDAIQSWLIETVVKQAVIKLLSFFNPAGAFVQACIAIYNTVMFLIERASQIVAFVEAVINSVAMIVGGNIAAAASWIENSLGKMIPLLIGFLARLIGLGGITDKIKEIIKKVQSFVDKAIDKVLSKIVAVVKKLFGKLTGKDKEKEKEGDPVAAAGQKVHAQLGDEATMEQAQSVLPEILGELQPQGLKSLTLGPENEEGDREILAEASPRRRVAKLVQKRIIVEISAQIEVEGEPVLTGITHGRRLELSAKGGWEWRPPEDPLAFAEFHAKQREALGGTGRAAQLPPVKQPSWMPAKKGDQPSAGLIIEPEAGSRKLEVLAWNTSSPAKGTNVSHAERQFVEWIEGRPHTWLQRVVSLRVSVEGRPICPDCESDLKRLKNKFHREYPKMNFTYAGPQAKPTKSLKVGN